jgi:hypothetical protein
LYISFLIYTKKLLNQMSLTFSINVGQIVQAERKQDIFSVLQELPDNTQKLISPKDVRDAFLTSWANSTFKITTPSTTGVEYIGIDSSNPSDRDVKKKILIGKRSFGNLDIMSGSLLSNSDADIFLYNTKSDSYTQSSTKIAILAGTDSNLYTTAPYIQAIYNTASNAIDLNLGNPSGNSVFGGGINIASTTGRIAINGIVFPTISETTASASNGKILRYFGTYPNGSLKWDDANVTLASIGSPNSQTDIYGSPINVNGYSLEFSENSLVPFAVGGVTQGASFATGSFFNGTTYQDWPMIEVLRDILYPYIPPTLTISAINNVTGTTYAEVGTTPSVTLSASLTTYARDSSEYISDHVISTSPTLQQFVYVGGSFSGTPGSSVNFNTSGDIFGATPSTLTPYLVNYTFAAANISTITASSYPSYFSYSATASIQFVSPFVMSFETGITASLFGPSNSQVARDIIFSNNANKSITYYPGASGSVSMQNTGQGYLYFMYPSSYDSGLTPSLTKIKDPNGFIIHDSTSLTYSAFTYSGSIVMATASYYPVNYYGSYRIFRTIATCSYNAGGSFEFIF